MYLRYGSSNYYIRQYYLGPIKKPNIILAHIKKPKLSTVTTKSKKRRIITPTTTNKAKSSDETSSVDESENE